MRALQLIDQEPDRPLNLAEKLSSRKNGKYLLSLAVKFI
jgi:hypothetical protein